MGFWYNLLVKFIEDDSVLQRLRFIVSKVDMPYVKPEALFCARSWGSKSNAIARIYSFPQVWQLALKVPPKYVIEVISEKFDKLRAEDQDRVLIHELMHIPKTFSGSLVPHNCFGKKRICGKTVEVLYQNYLKRKYEN